MMRRRANSPSRKKMVAPYSPCLMTSARGPISITLRAARGRLLSSASILASPSLISRTSTPLQHLAQILAVAADPVVHGVAADQLHLLHAVAHARLQHRIDVGEKQIVGVVVFGGNLRLKRLENVELGIKRLGFVDVLAVLAGPVKGLPFRVLDATGVHAALRHDRFVFRA